MKLKDFIYNKKTKESHLLGFLFVVAVTIVVGAVIYYVWIET
jgi:prolipoprotein diacylglyceryltransferase|tara:strand:+ start:457 stop:582 length:126 start_codon:yes stop_codon:yes gene_type:complete